MPLKIIIGGRSFPLAVQDNTAVIRRFSALVVQTVIDFLPFLSTVFDGTMSKYTGVSSMLAIKSYGKSPFSRTKLTLCLNCGILSSRSRGRV